MNYSKFDGTTSFSDFDPVHFLSEKFHHQNARGDKDFFVLNRDSSFILLKALKFTLSESQKKSISYLCSYAAKHDGNMPTPPKTPIKIDLNSRTIVDGIVRLFVLQYQRTDRVCWLEFEA